MLLPAYTTLTFVINRARAFSITMPTCSPLNAAHSVRCASLWCSHAYVPTFLYVVHPYPNPGRMVILQPTNKHIQVFPSYCDYL